MECLFKAIDGTIFNDEDECVEYERGLNVKNRKIMLYDSKLNLLDYCAHGLETCIYVYVETEEDFDVVYNDLAETGSETYGFDYKENSHFYYWSDDEEWRDIDDEIFYYNQKVEELIKAKDTMKKG